MFYYENDLKDYKLVAPDIDALLHYFNRRYMDPTSSTPALLETVSPLFEALSPLGPVKNNDEAKAIWLRIPRGTIEDYGSFEDMREWHEVETREEYEALWLEEYPEELAWYELVAVKSFNGDGSLRYCGISLGNKTTVVGCPSE